MESIKYYLGEAGCTIRIEPGRSQELPPSITQNAMSCLKKSLQSIERKLQRKPLTDGRRAFT